MPWGRESQPTGNTPTLLLIGEFDSFQNKQANEVFSAWAKNNPASLKFFQVPAAGHGVLRPIEGNPQGFVSVLTEMNNLISIVLGGVEM